MAEKDNDFGQLPAGRALRRKPLGRFQDKNADTLSTHPGAYPAGVGDFTLGIRDGMNSLLEPSSDTQTVIRHDGPILETQIRHALQLSQRATEMRRVVDCGVIKNRYPMIAKWCDEHRITNVIIGGELGKKDPHQEAVYAIAQTIQYPPSTVDRYFRDPSEKARSAGSISEVKPGSKQRPQLRRKRGRR